MHSKHGKLAGGSDCQVQNLAWTTSRTEREGLLTASCRSVENRTWAFAHQGEVGLTDRLNKLRRPKFVLVADLELMCTVDDNASGSSKGRPASPCGFISRGIKLAEMQIV